MSEKLEVSFNSPQCGWMSVGFSSGGENEFHTTTAFTPHSQALSEILNGLSSLLDAKTPRDEFTIQWSRNPEAYDLRFLRDEETLHFELIEFPTFDRVNSEGKLVFSYEGNVTDFCAGFYETFQQLYEERLNDEFEQNWRQPFPVEEFGNFKTKLEKIYSN